MRRALIPCLPNLRIDVNKICEEFLSCEYTKSTPSYIDLDLRSMPNPYAQEQAMSELGLSRDQVSAERFNHHTINAIKAELAKEEPLSLEAAFAKYRNLNYYQVKAMSELGLSRDQVSVNNFYYYTIDAIKAELAKEEPLSLDEIYAKCCFLLEGQEEKDNADVLLIGDESS